jgi:hypothetical protein
VTNANDEGIDFSDIPETTEFGPDATIGRFYRKGEGDVTHGNEGIPLAKEAKIKGKYEQTVVYPLYKCGRRYFERLSTARCYARFSKDPLQAWISPERRVDGKAWEVVR